MPEVRVYLGDGDPLYLARLVRATEARIEVELVGHSQDGREALADLKQLKPDVALLDVGMPELSGMRILAAAKRGGLPTRIILLSVDGEDELVYEAIAKGAAGYLSKLTDRSHIVDAAVAVSRGRIVLSPESWSGIAREIQLRDRDTRLVQDASVS